MKGGRVEHVSWPVCLCLSVRRVGVVVSALDSHPGGPGSSPASAAAQTRNILGQDVHSHVLRSTQPCILPGSLNRVPASAGVKAGMSPLPGGR